MTDNQLFTLLRSTVIAGLQARGYTMGAPNWEVARKFQPIQQGMNSAPTVYLFKVNDKLHGSPQRKATWDGAAMQSDTSQQVETSFQVSVTMTETTDPNGMTPSDMLNVVADTLQSDDAATAFLAAQVGILRVGAVKNPYAVNDRNRYDADPSFDFVVTHRRATRVQVPEAKSINPSFNRM